MAKITRPNINIKGFASNAASGERTVFNGEQVTDNLALNINDDYKRGFKVYGPEDVPKIKDFNGFGFTMNRLSAYLFQSGIAEWDENQEYYEDQKCQLDGVIYVSNTDNNIGNSPVDVEGNPAWVNDANAVSPCQGLSVGISGSENRLTYICEQSAKAYTYRINENSIQPINIQGSDVEFDESADQNIISVGDDLTSLGAGTSRLVLSTDKSSIIYLGSGGSLDKPQYDTENRISGTSQFETLPETSSGLFEYIILPISGNDFLAVDTENGLTYFIDYDAESVTQTSSGEIPASFYGSNSSQYSPSVFSNGFLYIMGTASNRIYKNSTQNDYSSFDEIIISGESGDASPVEMVIHEGTFYIVVRDFISGFQNIISTNDFVSFSEVDTPISQVSSSLNNTISIKGSVDGIFLFTSTSSGSIRPTYIYFSESPENVSSYNQIYFDDRTSFTSTIYNVDSQMMFSDTLGGLRRTFIIDKTGGIVSGVGSGVTFFRGLFSAVANPEGQEIIETHMGGSSQIILQSVESVISNGVTKLYSCFSRAERFYTLINGTVKAYNLDNSTGDTSRVGNSAEVSSIGEDADICSISSSNLPSNSTRDYILVYTSNNGEVNAYTFDGLNFSFYGLVYTAQSPDSKSQLVQLRREGGEVVFNDRSASQFVKISVGSGGVFSVDATVSNSVELSNPIISKSAEGEFSVISTTGTEVLTYNFDGVDVEQTAPDMGLGLSGLSQYDVVPITSNLRVIRNNQINQLKLFNLRETPVQSTFWRFLDVSNNTFDGSEVGLQSTNVQDAIKETLTEKRYRVGSIYANINLVDPATVLGFGTWSRIEGKFIVGHDESDPDFSTAGQTGGNKDHVHSGGSTSSEDVVSQISRSGWGAEQGGTTLPEPSVEGRLVTGSGRDEVAEALESCAHSSVGPFEESDNHTHTTPDTESDSTLPEYVSFYLWERIG